MPLSIKTIYGASGKCKRELPLFLAKISAGFPSPADDYIDKNLDLNEYVIKHPSATFFVRVKGTSMINAGIHNGDILVVDRSLEPAHHKIVIAVLDGELTVKRVRKAGDHLYLMPENDDFEAIEVTEETDFQIWGVVTYAIHSL
jgi:DNA polymerase V